MKKNIKRLMAVLIVMVMIISMCSTAFAAGHGSKRQSHSSKKSWTKEVTDQTSVTDPVVEETTETSAEDQAMDETVEPAPEDTATDSAAVSEESDGTSEDVLYPETTFPTIQVNDTISVDIYAEEGALPEGTEPKVAIVSNDNIAEAAAEVTEGDILFALDISFWYNGEEIEPVAGKNVSVSIKSDEIAEAEEIEVVHIDDADNASLVEQDESDNNEAAFTTDEFSVYAVISTPTNIPDNRMLVIKYKDKYYAVQHDGSLMEADNYDSSTNTLTYENESAARFWLLYRPGYSGYWNRPYQLRYQVNSNSYMYLAPNSDNGLSNSGVNLTYSGNRISNGSNYLGVKENEDGTLSISGNNSQANAAEVYFASVEVSQGQEVRHIDILITAEADVTTALAYGDYYDADGTKVLTVTKTSGEKASASESVPIDTEDIENANLTAYKSDGHGNKTNEVLDNAFTISGYEPSVGETGTQVRSEGYFLVTTSTRTGSSAAARQDRLNNRVFYTMSVVKPVEFTLKYDYDNDGDLDILYREDGTPIRVTLYVTLSASFDYWDPRNECDGLHFQNDSYLNNWKNGDILWGNDAANGSGMDFVLGSNSGDDAKVIAMEITKHYVDTNGNPITVKNDQTLTFNVYTTTDDPDELIAQNIARGYDDASATLSDYSELESAGLYSGKTLSHSDTLKVGANTYMSLMYDYDAENGIYCIEETNPAETVTDINGKVWEYDSTRIETEYNWRNSSVSNTGKHVSTGTTSIPEAAGEYSYQGNSHWGDPDYDDDVHGGTLFNQFLEFDVYNIYKGDDYFYVYHSSDNTIEKISMADERIADDGTFNIVNETKSGNIYGGYYKAYNKAGMTDDQIISAKYTASDSDTYTYAAKTTSSDMWLTDSAGTAYTNGVESVDDTTYWNKYTNSANGAYTDPGTAMTPEKDTVYYLKEVPDVYLQPATYVVYDTHDYETANGIDFYQVKKLHLMTATDDGNYISTGFDVTTSKGINKSGSYAAEYWSKEVKVTKDGEAYDTLNAGSLISNKKGFIADKEITDYIVENANYRQIPYHITPDNIKVTSLKNMAVFEKNTRFNEWQKPGMYKSTIAKKAAYLAVTSE